MLSLKHAIALGAVTAVSAIAPKSTGSPMLRFQSRGQASAPEESTIPKVGETKPLSTAMKCVMSLLFLYFIVVMIQKILLFITGMKKMYAQAKTDMDLARAAMGIPEVKIPGMSSDEGKVPTVSAEDKAKLAAAVAQKKAADLVAKVPGGAAMNATAGAAKDMFMDMFNPTKLAKIQASMAMVPMFCILITFCRLRARVDLQTEPQPLAKSFMVVSTACLFVEILFQMLPDMPETPGATGCCTAAKGWMYTKELISLTVMLGLYAGIGVLIHQIFTLTFKHDQKDALGSGAADGVVAGGEAAAPAATLFF